MKDQDKIILAMLGGLTVYFIARNPKFAAEFFKALNETKKEVKKDEKKEGLK